MRRHAVRASLLAPLAVLAASAVAAAQQAVQPGQPFAVSEHRLDIYDVAGHVTLRRGTGSDIVVTATRVGPDGSGIKFEFDQERDRGVFRVVYPRDIDRIADPEGDRNGGRGRTTLRLRPDGTFGGDGNDEGSVLRRIGRRMRSDEIEIGGNGGFRGSANLEITVPDGRVIKLHLAVGLVSVNGVTGDGLIDTWGADAVATDIAGSWLFDTGSGNVEVTGAQGTLRIDTGSGSGTVRNMTGDLLDIDTGSGEVDVADVRVERFRFDTGSGDVRADRLTARHGVIDTGSGEADLTYAGGEIDDLLIDTGSGRVSLGLPANVNARLSIDTGSGGIQVARTGAIFERRDSDGMVLRFGEGRGRIRVDTGSGGVMIR